jgi:hypothetical protein
MSRSAGDTVETIVHETKPRDVIVLGVPTFGQVHVFWASRLFANLRHPMNRIVRTIIVVGREVGDARNEIVSRALAIEEQDPTLRCSHVFFVDDDVLVHPDALVKLLAHKRPIVSGLYFAKSSVPTPLVLSGEDEGTEFSWTPGDLVECWAHGMGVTLIEADVFRRLRAETDLGQDGKGYPKWFATTRDEALVVRPDGVPRVHNQTEDVYFLRRAASLGYQPAVDTSPQSFAFHWAQVEQRAYPIKQWFEYQRQGTITWEMPDGQKVVWGEQVA